MPFPLNYTPAEDCWGQGFYPGGRDETNCFTSCPPGCCQSNYRFPDCAPTATTPPTPLPTPAPSPMPTPAPTPAPTPSTTTFQQTTTTTSTASSTSTSFASTTTAIVSTTTELATAVSEPDSEALSVESFEPQTSQSTAIIVASIFGSLAGVFLIAVCIYFAVKKSKVNQNDSLSTSTPEEEEEEEGDGTNYAQFNTSTLEKDDLSKQMYTAPPSSIRKSKTNETSDGNTAPPAPASGEQEQQENSEQENNDNEDDQKSPVATKKKSGKKKSSKANKGAQRTADGVWLIPLADVDFWAQAGRRRVWRGLSRRVARHRGGDQADQAGGGGRRQRQGRVRSRAAHDVGAAGARQRGEPVRRHHARLGRSGGGNRVLSGRRTRRRALRRRRRGKARVQRRRAACGLRTERRAAWRICTARAWCTATLRRATCCSAPAMCPKVSV